MDKTAFITGITGQDGSYLAELLLEKGYNVIGGVRRTVCSEEEKYKNLKDCLDEYGPTERLKFVSCDVTDYASIREIIGKYDIDEVYNLAAQSHVGESFRTPISTVNINIGGVLNILEAIRNSNKDIRFYQASTSEIFGVNEKCPQNEETEFLPASPYAAAKLCSHHLVRIYRESYGIFACSGILFNHESPRRGENFVTRKITKAAARIKLGLQDKLELGNLDAYRDWGFAGDYVEAMWLMLQQDEPKDFVIASGETSSVREFLELVFKKAGLSVEEHVVINEAFFRPMEVPKLWGDPTRAENELGWTRKMTLKTLAIEMYEQDYEREEKKCSGL